MTLKLIYEPTIYLVARTSETAVNVPCWDDFLRDQKISWHSDGDSSAERLCETAGRLCYYSFGSPRPGGNKAYLQRILEQGHGSVLEHPSWSFIIAGISRSCSHELVRHRHLSYSQLSQRYVDESNTAFVVPPELCEEVKIATAIQPVTDHNEKLCRQGIAWVDCARIALDGYTKRANYLFDKIARRRYDAIEPFTGPIRPFDEWKENLKGETKTEIRKAARQAARSVLPNCTETMIFVTGNARAWRHVIEQRGSRHADDEIRRLAHMIWKTLNEEAPNLFGDYTWELQDGFPLNVQTPYRKV